MKPSEQFVAALGSWIDLFLRRSMHEFFVYSRQQGLSTGQIAALFLVHRKGTSSVSDVSDELEITSAAGSQLLERLVQQGLVARSEDPKDRRLKQIVLTKHGELVLQQGQRARQKWLSCLADRMPVEEQEQVIAALQLLLQRAHELELEPAADS